MNEYLTIPKLAQQLGLSDNTVRRYAKNYSQFFRKEIIDGWEQFPVDHSITLIRRISDICAAGKRRADVVAELAEEFDIVRQEPDTPARTDSPGPAEFGPETLAVLNRIANALEQIAERVA